MNYRDYFQKDIILNLKGILYNFSDIWKLKLERLRSVLQRRQDKLRKAAMKWFNSLLYRCFNIWKERVSEKKKYRQKVMSVFAKWKVLFFYKYSGRLVLEYLLHGKNIQMKGKH